MKVFFDHEKLDVYQEAIGFCGWVGEFLSTISVRAAAKDQLDMLREDEAVYPVEHNHDHEQEQE